MWDLASVAGLLNSNHTLIINSISWHCNNDANVPAVWCRAPSYIRIDNECPAEHKLFILEDKRRIGAEELANIVRVERLSTDGTRDVSSALGYLDGQVTAETFGTRRMIALRQDKSRERWQRLRQSTDRALNQHDQWFGGDRVVVVDRQRARWWLHQMMLFTTLPMATPAETKPS